MVRAALSDSAFIGISRHHLGRVVAELAGPWHARREPALRQRRGADRVRGEGAGHPRDLVFTDRVLVTLAVLRLQVPHAALAVMYGVHRSTVTRAVHEVRPLLAGRGYATPAGPRLHTLAGSSLAFRTLLPKVRFPMATRIEDAFMCAEHDGRVIATARYSEHA